MRNYHTLARAIDRICALPTTLSQPRPLAERIQRLHHRVSTAPLTIYQKNFLLRQLDAALELRRAA